MKKSKLFITVLLCVLFIFCFAFVACSPNSKNPSGSGNQEESYVNPSWQLSGKTKDYYIVNADGTLKNSLALEDMEVEFGTNVFLTLPIVIDGKANVLDVSYKVKDNAGIEVELVGGAFYAMSGTGYSIKYTVTGVDGKSKTFGNNIKVTGADQMYVGEDFIIELENLTQVKEEKLIKLNAQNTFDLTTLLSAEQLENVQKATTTDGVEVKWKVASKSTGTVELDSTQLDFSVFPKANYVVYVQAFVGETSQILFADVVDFYDITENFAYGEWSNIVHEKIDVSTLINTVADTTVTEITDNSTETVLAGKTEKYYKVDSVNGSKTYNFSFNPLHSNKYYETYLDANVNVSFEMYVTAEKLAGDTKEILGVFGSTTGKLNGNYHSGRCQFPANTWNKIEMPLDIALDGSMCNVESLFYVEGNTANAQSSTVYFGNFKIEQDVDKIVQNGVSLIDVKGLNSYALSDILGENEYQEFESVSAEYELLSFNAKQVTSIENGTIEFDKVPYGAYTLTVKSGGLVIHASNVDFYDSTLAPVYNDRLAKEYAFGYRATVGTSQNQQNRERIYGIIESVVLNETNHNGKYIRLGKNAQTPQSTIDGLGTWGTPLAFNVMAVHSKEYYELYQNYEVQFEYYISKSTTVATPFVSATTSMTAGWYTAKISVTDLLAKWDILHDNVETEGYGNNLFTTSFAWGTDEYYAYIGGFVMELKPIETDGATLLLDVKDMDSVNVDEIVEEGDYNFIGGETLNWSLTATHSNATYALTDGAINFTIVPYGAYVLQAKTANNKVVYSQNVDLYNSAKPEYNDIVLTDYVWGFRPNVANSVNSETAKAKNTVEVITLTETGHKGNYYATLGTSATAWLGTVVGYNVKSNHSKEYFELYRDYTVTFEYYLGNTNDNYSIYVATAFANAIPDKTAYGGDTFVGWHQVEIPVTTILEKWNAINEIDVAELTGCSNTMLSQSLTNSKNYTYFGNFKLEKIETLPETASETPAYNIVSKAVIKEDVWGLRSNSLTDGYYHSNGQKKLNVVEFTQNDSLLGKTSGKYYSFDGTIAVGNSTYYLGVAPYYEKSVYETYLTANPDAVMSFEFCSVQEGITNNIRRAWINALKNTTSHVNYLEVGKWYTITIPLKYVVDNFDAMSTAGSNWLISYEAFDNKFTANGTQDTTLTATQPTKAIMYFGNFQISASGTVGVI